MRSNRTGLSRRILTLAAAVIFGFAIFSVLLVWELMRYSFGRVEDKAYSIQLSYEDIDQALYTREEVAFNSEGNILYGYVYTPDTMGRGIIVVINGIESDADSHLAEAMYFVNHGWSVLCFDGTGVGRSEGEEREGLIQGRIDLLNVLDFIGSDPRLSSLPVVLYGHSMGGYAALSALCDDITVAGVVAISAFNSPLETMQYQMAQYSPILAAIEYPFIYMMNRVLYGATADLSALEGMNHTDTPVMVVYGTEDDVVPAEIIGIPSVREDIRNPNVEFVEVDAAYRNRHQTAWLSEKSAEYHLERWELFEELLEGGTQEEIEKYIEETDIPAMYELDDGIMGMIEEFYEECVTGGDD